MDAVRRDHETAAGDLVTDRFDRKVLLTGHVFHFRRDAAGQCFSSLGFVHFLHSKKEFRKKLGSNFLNLTPF